MLLVTLLAQIWPDVPLRHRAELSAPPLACLFSPTTEFDLADYFDDPLETTTRPAKPTPKPFPRPGKPGTPEPCSRPYKIEALLIRALGQGDLEPLVLIRFTFGRVDGVLSFLRMLSDNSFGDVIRTTTTKRPKTTRPPPRHNPGEHELPATLLPAFALCIHRRGRKQPQSNQTPQKHLMDGAPRHHHTPPLPGGLHFPARAGAWVSVHPAHRLLCCLFGQSFGQKGSTSVLDEKKLIYELASGLRNSGWLHSTFLAAI